MFRVQRKHFLRFLIVLLLVKVIFADHTMAQRDPKLQRRIDTTLREYCVIESVSQLNVRAPVNSTILWLAEEGTRVRKGDLVAKLADSALREKLDVQKIVFANAQAKTVEAKAKYDTVRRRQVVSISVASKILDAAKLTLKNFSGEKGTAQSQIVLAGLELAAAQEKLKLLQAIREQGTAMVAIQLIDAKLAVDVAKQQIKQLTERDHPQQKAELEAVVAKRAAELEIVKLDFDSDRAAAEAQLNSAESELKIEHARLEDLKKNLAACTIHAPADGIMMMAMIGREPVEEGTTVRERQTIARIVDGSNFQARVLVNESKIDKVKPGQPVVVAVSALVGEKLEGVVSSVNRFPEPVSFLGSNVKKYAVVVKLTKPSPNLRHGMSAQAEIKFK